MTRDKGTRHLQAVDPDADIPDPISFRIPASDGKGHTSRVFCRVQPRHHAAIESIVSSRQFPYRTKGDLFRHAIHRHMAYLSSLDKTIKSFTSQVDAIIEVVREEQFQIEFDETINKISSTVTALLSGGGGGETQARSMVLRIMNHVNEMPDRDEFWRERFRRELRRRYDFLISKAKPASLTDDDDE